MKTALITLLATIALSGIANASEGNGDKGNTTRAANGDHIAVTGNCFPASGNWVNAAAYSCPDRGYGGIGISHPSECKGPKNPK